MIQRVRIVVFFLMLFAGIIPTVSGQAVFDTLNLHEFEIIAIKDTYQNSFKKTKIDTLIKRDFEHFDLGQLLSAFSPVFIKSYGKGSISSASFRGTAASHTQVLWNDFAINSPMLGQVDFSYVPESFFDEVGLLYGGGSLYKTSGALGGSVLLDNNTNQSKRPLLHINQSLGSFGSYNTAVSLNLRTENFSSGTRAMFQSSKNDFSYYNNGVLPSEWMMQQNASFMNGGFLQQFSWQLTPYQRLSLMSWNQWNNRNIPPIMTNVYKGGNPEEYQNTFFSRNVLGWLFHKNKSRIEVKGAWFYEDQHYYLKTTTSDDSSNVVTLIDSKNNTTGFFAKSKWTQEFPRGWKTNVGLDLDYNKVISNNYEGVKLRVTTSFYAGLKKLFWEKLTLDALVRSEVTDGKLLPLMPLLGINYRVIKNRDLYVRTTFSRNYHLPTLNDLYWYPGGNINLKPEEGWQTEFGVNYVNSFSKNHLLALDVSAYFSKMTNWIQWKPSDYRFWTPENIADVYTRGVEVSVQMSGRMNDWYYRVSGEYAFTKTTDESQLAKDEGYNGRQLIYIPAHHGNLFLYMSYRNWSVGLNSVVTGERTTTMNPADSYSNSLPAYWLNDLQLGKKWIMKKVDFQLQAKINNMFDVQYQAILWRAMPGRNFEVTLKLDLK
jgi:iron complex outermembrane receptor protein